MKIPVTDSIHELAAFWDTHDITDFSEKLEEVTEHVFEKETAVHSFPVVLEDHDIQILKKIAKQLGKNETELVSEWIHHKIHEFT